MGRMTLGQEIAVASTTILGGLLSLAGSTYIVFHIAKLQKYKEDTYHRLLLGISLLDILSSIGWIMAPFAPPKDSSMRHLAIGTKGTCNLSGLLLQTGTGFMVYNACMALHYLLTIRYGVTQRQMVGRERIMHIVAICWTLVASAVIPLPLTLYNELEVGTGCWFGYFPLQCKELDLECTRGTKPRMMSYLLAALPTISSLLIVLVANLLIYLKARQMELRSRRHSLDGQRNEGQVQRTKSIAKQALYYVLVFANCQIWQMVIRTLDGFDIATADNESTWTPLILLAQFFSSSAGLGFLLTYIRPRYLRLRQDRQLSRQEALVQSLAFEKTSNGSFSRKRKRNATSSLTGNKPAPDKLAGISGSSHHDSSMENPPDMGEVLDGPDELRHQNETPS